MPVRGGQEVMVWRGSSAILVGYEGVTAWAVGRHGWLWGMVQPHDAMACRGVWGLLQGAGGQQGRKGEHRPAKG